MTPRAGQERLGGQVRRLWLWLLPGLAIASFAAVAATHRIELFPPSVTRDSAEFATASTQVLVDFPGPSVLLETKNPVTPLAERAGVFARLAAAPAIRDLVGEHAGIDPQLIDARGPYNPDAERALREPTAERRASQLRAEQQEYRLRFDTETYETAPLVLIHAQAPTAPEAKRLADAGAAALREYVRGVQRRERLPNDERLELRTLGDAEGGVVNPGADKQIALLAFLAALLSWAILVLVVANVSAYLRRRFGAAPTPPTRPPEPPRARIYDIEAERGEEERLAGSRR